MEKKTKRSYDVIIFGILTLIAALTWVGLELYRNANKAQDVTPVTQYHTTPLSPTLDTTILDTLQKRLVVSPSQIPVQPVSASGSANVASNSGTF